MLSPQTTIADLVALARGAALMVSGDTGPTHIAAAVGTPLVGIYGPTRPARNGPMSPLDVTVSSDARLPVPSPAPVPAATRMCLLDIEVAEVLDAVERRLAARRLTSRAPTRPLIVMRRWRGFASRSVSCSASLVLVLAQPTPRSLVVGDVDRGVRRGDPDLGGRVTCDKSREVTVVGAVSLGRAPAVCRLLGDGRGSGDRVGQRDRRGADRALSRRHADRRDQE